MPVATAAVAPYRPYRAHVVRAQRLSPAFVRLTLGGDDLATFSSAGWDQRVKVLLPLPGQHEPHCPEGADWYAAWRALPDAQRCPMRTYTVRNWRPDVREVDVDFVLHGPTGPAGAWAERARPGDPVVVVGPDARFDGDAGGVAWAPPPGAAHLLVAGDETAVPAACAIAERLPGDVPATVLLEVPSQADVLPLATPPGVDVIWLPRLTAAGAAEHGSLLTEHVLRAVDRLLPTGEGPAALAALDDDDPLLWDVPDAGAAARGLYAWLAGEAGTVTALRRALVGRGVDRRGVAFMGYWRRGVAQPS